MLLEKRLKIIVGHYGSGKTEFSVNYALKLADNMISSPDEEDSIALIDLDIANPYFRSREKRDLLESKGIKVLSNQMGYDITADLPAISSAIKGPLLDKKCQAIIDAGGDQSGARIINQFSKYLTDENSEMLCIINANRPEAATLEGAMNHIEAIEAETGLKVKGLINNTHMLRETSIRDILKGDRLCKALFDLKGLPVKYTCCTKALAKALRNAVVGGSIEEPAGELFPLRIYMRASWLDL